VVINQLLPRDFAGGHVFRVAGYEIIGALKLFVCLVRIGFLQF